MIQDQEAKEYKILDWIILSLFVIFLLSLSNSIFVNQVGYFGALLFILVKAFLTKKNPFSKTGLELAFILYMLAEILSLLFSDYKAQAFHFFTKRALLIPVVYTTIASVTSLKRGKDFFILFVAGTLITSIIYLVVSFRFYLNNLYVITQSGPSLFQNPITASEIISFVVLILFAFVINEKSDRRIKLLIWTGFIISSLTLIATYKRTGWMGVAAGIILILIIKRKWKILLPVFILGLLFLLMDKNISEVNVFNFEGSGLKKLYSFNTEGRAVALSESDSLLTISDYENGILFYKDSTLVRQIKTPEPATVFEKVSDSLFLAQLIDTRFLIFKKDGNEFIEVNEILPPGYTKYFVIDNEALYVLDSDSGLTFYQSPLSQLKFVRFPQFKDYKWVFIDSSNFYFISEKSGIDLFSKKGIYPGEFIARYKTEGINRAFFFDGNLFVSSREGLKMFSCEKNEIVLKDQLPRLKNVNRMTGSDGTLAVLSSDGTVNKIMISDNRRIKILAEEKISPPPTNFYLSDQILYCSRVNRGRLLSFFDPYLPQNFTRLALWRGGWKIFKDYPLFGVGDIGIEKYYVKYKRPSDKEIHGHLHNNYIHFLATLGLFGFCAVIFLFVMIIKLIAKIYRDTKDKPFIASYSLGALASFVSILVSGLSELNFWDHEIATLIYFTVGLNVALYLHYKKENQYTEAVK